MPWKESSKVSERFDFVQRLRAGERMTDLCREFGISRTTGDKYKKRFEQLGVNGLYDESRRPKRSPNRTPSAILERIIDLRKRHPTWGPKKLKVRLHDLEPGVKWPAASTIGVVLKDAGLVGDRRRRRRSHPTSRADLRETNAPNELWCMDFKGKFRMLNRRYCHPLTVSDHFSRALLGCEALENEKADPTAAALELVFREHGLPDAFRFDNGSPFASTGLLGLTTLSVWLLRLDIALERIEPGHPEQNGRHERMHRTLKEDTTRPPGANLLQQQERFDRFRRIFNDERPHESLEMKTPSRVHRPARRRLPKHLNEVEYPLHDVTQTVYRNGLITFGEHRAYISTALAGQRIGLRQVSDQTWLASFMSFELGYIDTEANRLIPPN